jgi:beta-glucosidase
LADKVLRVEHGPLPAVGAITEVAIVDDDHHADGPSVERTGIAEAMRLGGNDARLVDAPTAASGGPFVIALFADFVEGKGRTTLLPDTREQVHTLVAQATAMQRPVILVGLGDPRWVAQLGLSYPTLLAWGGDRVMQQAAGRGLLRAKAVVAS